MDWFHTVVGQSSQTITWWQMSIRALLLFLIAVVVIRLAGDRIFGKNTVLDIVLGVVLGSNFSRAMTGNAEFIPVVVSTVVLVAVHTALAHLAWHSKAVSRAVKGEERQLVEDGTILWKAMRRQGIAEGDLAEAMRQQGVEPDLDQIQDAFLERSGKISIITRQSS